MKIFSVFFIIVVAAVITLYEWPKINADLRKEKRAFVVLLLIGSILSAVLVFFPEMPGPTEFVQWVVEPITGWMK